MKDILRRVTELSETFLGGLRERSVGARGDADGLRASLGGPLPEAGEDPLTVIEALARGAEPGLHATPGPRFFGFVIGGSLPAALGAEWLTAAWDQNAALYLSSPAAAIVEESVAGWVIDLLGLQTRATVGFVTGGQMANFTGLAAGRHAVLARAGWDVEQDGLIGAPEVNVVIGEEAHATILSALQMLGLGAGRAKRVAADAQGRMRPNELAATLRDCAGPTIVCAQAGNVNTGAFDPLEEIGTLTRTHGAWLHIDGAFGLWAAVCPSRCDLAKGVELADSWATDGHKWLNVPYDSGIAIVADAEAHRAAMSKRAAYLIPSDARDPHDYTPESSRRARGFALWVGLRNLGRQGVADLVERCCGHAARVAVRLQGTPGIRIMNEVVLNQVLVRFEAPHRDGDALTRAVISRVQQEGTCWLGGTKFKGQEAMRISISNWSTTEGDMDRTAEVIIEAARREGAGV